MATPSSPSQTPFAFSFEGEEILAHPGDTIAEALWRAGIRRLSRSPKYHRPRGAFCFAGQCGTCLMRIDGRPNMRACQVPAAEGVACQRQNAFPDADVDVLRAADWLFPHGMDHHHLMTGTKVGNSLFVKLVRQMGGTGVVPDQPDDRFLPHDETHVETDVAIVGAGPAGLAAATAIRQSVRGARVVLIDQRTQCGGSWLAEPDGVSRAKALEADARAAGVDLWLGSVAFAHYAEDGGERPQHVPGVLAVLRPSGVALLAARRFVFATGTYEQNMAFVGNDRPGIIAARAFGRLLFSRGMQPPKRLQLVDDGAAWAYGTRLAEAARARAVEVQTLTLAEAAEAKPSRACVVAVAALPAPAFELPRQHGVGVSMRLDRGGFCAEADAEGRTAAPNVFLTGDVTGYVGPQKAQTHGSVVGRAVGSSL